MNKYLPKLLGLLAVFFVCGTIVASASFDLKAWPYERIIQKQGEQGMVKVRLPKDISWVTDDFRDLRVIDDRGVEIPYVMTKDIKPAVPMIDTNIINSVSSSDGSTKFVVDTGRGGVVRTSLFIETNKPNYRRQVSLYSSDVPLALEDSRWATVSKDGYIFSFTDPVTNSRQGKNSIMFSPNTSRYFKVVISNGEEGSVVASSVKVYGDLEIALPEYRSEYPVNIYNNPDNRTTEVVVDLGMSGIYSDSVTLDSKDTNYTRKVVVEASNSSSTAGAWSYVGQGFISSVRTSLYKGSSNIVNYGPIRARYIKLSIVNDDNPVIAIDPKVIVTGPVYEIVFDAKQDRNYKIYYGNTSAVRSQYDITNFASYIESAKLPSLALGQEIRNSSYVAPAGPVVPFTEKNKWLLNTILVIVVLVIALGIGLYLMKYHKKYTDSTFPSDNKKPEDLDQNDNFVSGRGL